MTFKISSIFQRQQEEPKIQFGRSEYLSPNPQIYRHWDNAVAFFENEKYLASFKSILQFLHGKNPSVSYAENGHRLQFSMLHGSKIIFGHSNAKKFTAYAQIVSVESLPSEVAKTLLEINHHLEYCSYSIDKDQCIMLRFEFCVEDASPYKIYNGLQELVFEADRQDDVLGNQYPELHPINTYHVGAVSSKIARTKYDFIKAQIMDVEHDLQQLDAIKTTLPGAISYVLLDFFYSIDYLIKPQGKLMEHIRDVHETFFSVNTMNVIQKNDALLQTLREIKDIDFDSFKRELYETYADFDQVNSFEPYSIQDVVKAQIKDLEWYKNNGYDVVSASICGFIIGYSFYTLSLTPSLKSLLHTFYMVRYTHFFGELGYHTSSYIDKGNKLKLSYIKNHIKHGFINEKNGWTVNVKKLKSQEIDRFYIDYVDMLAEMNFINPNSNSGRNVS